MTAKSVLVLDRSSGAVLFEKNPYQRLPFASLTKLMTALITLDSGINIDEVMTIPKKIQTEGTDIDFPVGEKIRLRDLLYATLIASGNDTALLLAEYVASNTEDFVKRMNQKAQDLNLKHTNFQNPTGLDAPDHLSCVYDLALLFNYVLQKEEIYKALGMKEYTSYSLSSDQTFLFENTNKLLESFLNIKAGKTGFTDNAGHCLAVLVEKDGHEIISVMLGSEDAFQDTKALVSWVFDNYSWE